MKAKPEVIELEIQKLDTLLETIRANLGEEVAGPFRDLLDGYRQLVEIIAREEITLQKLRQIVFGAKTERTRNVLGPDLASSPEGAAITQDAAADDGAALVSVFSTLEEGISSGEASEQDNASGRRRKGHGREHDGPFAIRPGDGPEPLGDASAVDGDSPARFDAVGSGQQPRG
jgi:hypothetical protein